MTIARVFPRRTRATPTDDLAFARMPLLADFAKGIDRVHVSVSFSWDKPLAETMAKAWEGVAPVTVGGPAYDDPAGEFVPGMYLKPGYVITSRGCPRCCDHCTAWRREGRRVRTLPIRDGWNVLDNNLLACPSDHVRQVFAMLSRQPQPAEFTGGLEAAIIRDWHVKLIADLKPKQLFFAYDEPDDWEPLVVATAKIHDAWPATLTGPQLRCYVLIGMADDTMEAAERRLWNVVKLGVRPMAMLWRGINGEGHTEKAWKRFQREWANPRIVGTKMKQHPLSPTEAANA
jgi:hypothetical protein